MQRLILDITGKFLLFSVIFLAGCANKDIAQKAYINGDFNTSYKIWNDWADKGFGEGNFKLASLANRGLIKKDDNFIINNATKAYERGYYKAANILEERYYKIGDYKKSFYWFKKVDINSSNLKQFNMHIALIINQEKEYEKQQEYLQKIEKLAQRGNVYAAFSLGKLYENREYPFYNIQRSVKFYTIAHNKNYVPAGIKLGLIYIYQLNNPKKGIHILKDLSIRDNGKVAFQIGNYLFETMETEVEKLNTPCTSFDFNTPEEFYTKKLTIQEFKKRFMYENILPWYRYSYERGYYPAMLKLISLDADENNFFKDKTTYSKMNLKESIGFLKASQFFKAKMVLAKIYEKYPMLHKEDIAKSIYIEYAQYNKLDAYWHLYQFYKRFYPLSKEKQYYLSILVTNNFEPAQIESAYFSMLNKKEVAKNLKILNFYADNNNILALTYLGSIYSKGILEGINRVKACKTYKKLCRLGGGLNSSLDLKIANCYMKIFPKKDVVKAATIYKYYADENNSQSQYHLANIYKGYCDINKTTFWLSKSKELGNIKAEFEYSKLVLSGDIDGNITQAINSIRYFADKNNSVAIMMLGNLYANGEVVDLNPRKAIAYYNQAIKLGDNTAYLKISNLYKKIDVANNMYKKIIKTYKKAIYAGNVDAKLLLAEFYVNKGKYNKAKRILYTIDIKKYPKAKFLLYKITGKKKYLKNAPKTNYGNLLLEYAKLMEKKDKNKALLYTFRASICNVDGSSLYSYHLMKMINNSKVILQIYKKAKSYPKCIN